jgi:cob(I)alamin adenosyltransferase
LFLLHIGRFVSSVKSAVEVGMAPITTDSTSGMNTKYKHKSGMIIRNRLQSFLSATTITTAATTRAIITITLPSTRTITTTTTTRILFRNISNTTKSTTATTMNENEEEKKNKKSMLYTKTGDKGESSLFNGKRKPKDDAIFDALGTVDELNAHVGMSREFCKQVHNGLSDKLEIIQSRLLDIGACVATPIDTTTNESKLKRVQFDEKHVSTLESWIDELDSQLPPLKNFILPSGGLSASALHITRTVCRRAERCVVPLVREGQTDRVVQIYLNRLSDFFFAAARFAAHFEKREEVLYRKDAPSVKYH